MAFLAKHVTGQYDFTYIPIALPSPLVLSLLTYPFSAEPSPILDSQELAALGLKLPPIEEGTSWVVVQSGKQIGTGVSLPGGKSDFFEAKLEIPFLRHPDVSSTIPFTLKQHLLFSTTMMAISSSKISGLRSSKAAFEVSSEMYEAKDWLKVSSTGEQSSESATWSTELVKEAAQGWWVGERTGGNATRFHFEDLSPPTPRDVLVRLNLPKFLGKNIDLTQVQGLNVDPEGWLEIIAKGYDWRVATKMEAKRLDSFA